MIMHDEQTAGLIQFLIIIDLCCKMGQQDELVSVPGPTNLPEMLE